MNIAIQYREKGSKLCSYMKIVINENQVKSLELSKEQYDDKKIRIIPMSVEIIQDVITD